MTGATKTLDEGIEEAAAFLLRETYPTYSKVPEFIKAIRKLPIGNFVSFTSEILRTGFATSAIASDACFFVEINKIFPFSEITL